MRREETSVVLGIAAFVLALGGAGCSDDATPEAGPGDGGGPPGEWVASAPIEATLELPFDAAAVGGFELRANQHVRIAVPVSLPEMQYIQVASARIDGAAALSHVRFTPTGPVPAGAERLAVEGTARFAARGDLSTVCATGELYGPFRAPFTAEGRLAGTLDPPSGEASEATLGHVNTGAFALCVDLVSPIDARVSADALVLAYRLGMRCAEAPADVAGTWAGTYACTSTCGAGFGGDVRLDVTRDGVTASYTDDPKDPPFVGVVCGRRFMFTRTVSSGAERETEVGSFTLDPDGRTATKRSYWRSGRCSGVCQDQLTRR